MGCWFGVVVIAVFVVWLFVLICLVVGGFGILAWLCALWCVLLCSDGFGCLVCYLCLLVFVNSVARWLIMYCMYGLVASLRSLV